MSEPLKSVHVRLDPPVHAAAKVLAQAQKIDISQLCEEIIRESLLGKFHLLKVAAEEMARLGLRGSDGDSGGA
jgi:hypothetical protein